VKDFPAQANGYGFVEAANGIDEEGVEFDSLRFGITEFSVGAQVGEVLLLKRIFGFNWICSGGKTGMAGDKAEHSDGDVFRLSGGEHFLNHIGVVVLPVRMKDAGVDSETDAVAVALTTFGGVDSLFEVRCIQFIMPDCFAAVDAPGDDCLVVGFDGKEVIDVSAFGKQH
jgi:hypothetical protein